MKTKINSSTLLLLSVSAFIVLAVFFLYTFLHEAGHAIAGILFGQSLAEFDLSFWDFSAHVNLSGGTLTGSQLAIRSAAGAGLPLLVWALFISLAPRKANFLPEILKLVSSMLVVNTLLPWIILPILFAMNRAPSDDVTNFLRYSQMPPLLLSLAAAMLYAAGWFLFLSRIDGLRNEFLLFRMADSQALLAGARKTILRLAGVLGFCILLTFIFQSSASAADRFAPPQGFEPVARLDLSTQAYPAKTLAQFSLEQSAYVGVFVVIQNINTSYFDLQVSGPDGYRSIVLHGEGYNAAQDGGLWEKNLPPGAYQLVLTSHQSPGTLTVDMRTYE